MIISLILCILCLICFGFVDVIRLAIISPLLILFVLQFVFVPSLFDAYSPMWGNSEQFKLVLMKYNEIQSSEMNTNFNFGFSMGLKRPVMTHYG